MLLLVAPAAQKRKKEQYSIEYFLLVENRGIAVIWTIDSLNG
jgi:hypothetical protein